MDIGTAKIQAESETEIFCSRFLKNLFIFISSILLIYGVEMTMPKVAAKERIKPISDAA